MKKHRSISGYLAGALQVAPRCSGVRSRQLLCAYVAAALLSRCGAPAGGDGIATPLQATPLKPAAAGSEAESDALTPALDAVLIQHVPEGTFGPYLGTSPGGHALALWAALTPSSGRRWFSTTLDAKGTPLAPARSLAEAPGELALASVSSAPHGFLALATGVTESGTQLEALALGPAGELISGPTPIAHERSEVLWLKAMHVDGRAVALWATLAVGAVDIHLAALDPSGATPPSPVRVLEGARAWQAVEFRDGIALAALLAGPGANEQRLRVTFLDLEGHVLGRTDVAAGSGLAAQLDAARIGDNLVLGWTQRDGLDARLYLAALGPDTRLAVAPRPATAPFGVQRLLEIVAPADPGSEGWLAWENVGQAPRGQLRFQIARLSEQARLGAPGAELSFVGGLGERPEFALKGQGLAALTRAVPCSADAAPCTLAEPTPTFVELGPELQVLASEPVRLAPEAGRVADLAWGLHCSEVSCAALGALPAAPVPVFGVELRARSKAWAAVARRIEESAPRAEEMRSVADADPLADVAVAPGESSSLVAWLTQFDESTPYVRPTTPAPDGRLAPVRALLRVQPFRADGSPGGAARVVSYRARAPSGIALARASAGRALLAWSALDNQRPEVFATLLGPSGQTLQQRMLTVGAGEISQVGAAALPAGYVVAWVGRADGEPQVFAERLGEDLRRAAPQRRLSQPPGVATALSLLARENSAWLASVQRRDNEQVLALARLEPRALAPQGEALEIARTESASLLSPTLVARADGALLAWIERPLVGGDETQARFVELDAEGRPRAEPIRVSSRAGDPVAVRLLCDAERCQGVLDCRAASGHVLEGFSVEASQASSPDTQLLVHRASAPADAAAFALGDNALFYADRSAEGGLLRRLGVRWR